jgi:hypothetical protein
MESLYFGVCLFVYLLSLAILSNSKKFLSTLENNFRDSCAVFILSS